MVTFIRNLHDQYFLFLNMSTLKLRIIIIALPTDCSRLLVQQKLSCVRLIFFINSFFVLHELVFIVTKHLFVQHQPVFVDSRLLSVYPQNCFLWNTKFSIWTLFKMLSRYTFLWSLNNKKKPSVKKYIFLFLYETKKNCLCPL